MALNNLAETAKQVVQKTAQAVHQAPQTGKLFCDRFGNDDADLVAQDFKKSFEHAEWAQKEKRRESARVPYRFRDAKKNIETIYAATGEAEEYLDYIGKLKENADNGVGLVLMGTVGTGKTTVACGVLQTVTDEGYTALYVNVPVLVDMFLNTPKEESQKLFNDIITRKFVLFDDLGTESNDWAKTKIEALFVERFNNCLPTLVTTNLSPVEIKAAYSERFIDRLRSSSFLKKLTGASKRTAPCTE